VQLDSMVGTAPAQAAIEANAHALARHAALVNEQTPLPRATAWAAVARCTAASVALLVRRRVHIPSARVGVRLQFATGASAVVYRETVVDRADPEDPCVLVVAFRLRAVRGRGHAFFRWESVLNTPLFVGFPGFGSKLWLAADDHGVYRGLYEWNGAAQAEYYARALWRVLALVSVPGSIRYRVLPGLRREDVLVGSHVPDADPSTTDDGRAAQRQAGADR